MKCLSPLLRASLLFSIACLAATGCSDKKKKPAEPVAAAKEALATPAPPQPLAPPQLPEPTPESDLPPAIAAGAKDVHDQLVRDQLPPLEKGTECRLLSIDEASALLGSEAAPPDPNKAGCSWRSKTTAAYLAVDVRPASDWLAAEMLHKSPEKLPAIAEKAFYGELGGHHVFAIVNGRLLQVSLFGQPGADAKARTIDTAAKVAARVPKA